jgi:hypothetical protein
MSEKPATFVGTDMPHACAATRIGWYRVSGATPPVEFVGPIATGFAPEDPAD